LPEDLDLGELQADVRGRKELMAAVEHAHQVGKAVDTGRGHSGGSCFFLLPFVCVRKFKFVTEPWA